MRVPTDKEIEEAKEYLRQRLDADIHAYQSSNCNDRGGKANYRYFIPVQNQP